MRGKIAIHLSKFQKIYGSPTDCTFLGLFSKDVFEVIDVINDSEYSRVQLHAVETQDIPFLIMADNDKKHIFCITTDATFRSPELDPRDHIKLGVLPFFSTQYSFEKLKMSIEIIFEIDYNIQYDCSRQVLEKLEDSDAIIIESKYDTVAQLDLLYPNQIYFFNQSGPLKWGQQLVLPNGEISLLTNGHGQYSSESKFSLNGSIVFEGYPVLHYGNCPCSISRYCTDFRCDTDLEESKKKGEDIFNSRNKQSAIFERLTDMEDNPVIARIEKGIIKSIDPIFKKSHFYYQLLELFDDDSNYCKVHEFGIGFNRYKKFLSKTNFLPNEMIRGIHFGLGLTPFTEFHLDLVCNESDVFVSTDKNKARLIEAPPFACL